MDLCCNINRKKNKDINKNINKDIDNNNIDIIDNNIYDINNSNIDNNNTQNINNYENSFNVINIIKNFFNKFNKKTNKKNNIVINENINVAKLIFEKNNLCKKELNKNHVFYLRLKYPLVTLYEIPDSCNIICNLCFRYTKEETFRVLPCSHYCHASCLDYLGKIYTNNIGTYGNVLIFKCKLCNKNINL